MFRYFQETFMIQLSSFIRIFFLNQPSKHKIFLRSLNLKLISLVFELFFTTLIKVLVNIQIRCDQHVNLTYKRQCDHLGSRKSQSFFVFFTLTLTMSTKRFKDVFCLLCIDYIILYERPNQDISR